MTERTFVDHYEVLQLSPTADSETVERVFRLLAKRYHPDNTTSGEIERFNEVRAAFELLSSPGARAAYDVNYDHEKALQWEIFEQGTAKDDRGQDRILFHAILSLLYVARRRDPEEGGLAPFYLERTLGTPREHLEFPLWYLKKRGLVEILESGKLAITVDGIDKLGSGELSLPHDRLLTEQSLGEQQRDGEAPGRQRSISDGQGDASKKTTDPEGALR